jgi:hypothetical protein
LSGSFGVRRLVLGLGALQRRLADVVLVVELLLPLELARD